MAPVVASGSAGPDVRAPERRSDNVWIGRDRPRGWNPICPGNEMQSKDAGLKGLASPVVAAGGESTG
jgi:hypothetical protein